MTGIAAFVRPRAAHLLTLAALGAVLVVTPAILNDYEIYLLTLIGAYTLASFGLVILTGHGGMLNLGFAGLLAAGAYLGAHYTNEGASLLVAISVALVAGSSSGSSSGSSPCGSETSRSPS